MRRSPLQLPGRKARKLRRALVIIALCCGILPSTAQAGLLDAPPSSAPVSVIVRQSPGAGEQPEAFVEAVGGDVSRQIGIIDGFEASIPASEMDALGEAPGVFSVTPNESVELLSFSSEYDPGADMGSIYNLARAIDAPEYWKKGYTGKGIDVALLDSGVLPVQGLNTPGKVINGPDLSFESQAPNLRYLDTYGHGTHMAGIIAGRDPEVVPGAEDKKEYVAGVAPDARIINLKLADSEGATDVSQVIAAIDWVVEHRNDNGMNIRVLNLSFGTDGTQDYRLDPLSFAAEVAWRKGIVVVVSAGNAGYGSAKLNNPAYNPYVIAVGAVKANGTPSTTDDIVPEWSSTGDGVRNPDVVAPGQSVTAFRAPGSYLDVANPQAVAYDRFFRGSGTSQSAAAVSGAAALILDQRPDATPDQVKRLLMKTATPLPNADPVAQGEGIINLKKLLNAPTPHSYRQTWPHSTGLGSLDLARGSAILSDGDIELRGEIDIHGDRWNPAIWAVKSVLGRTWIGGDWMGRAWSGSDWSGNSWTARTWGARTWGGSTWSGRTWASLEWLDNTWSGDTWEARTWGARTWQARTWGARTWGARTWGARTWASVGWDGP